MKHAILILAHKNFAQLTKLLATFKGEFDVFVHIDKRSSFTAEELQELTQQPGVAGVYRKYKIHWSGFNMLRSELFLLKKALQNCNADYFHLISGQDYPIKSLTKFKAHFEVNKGKEFISYMELPSPNWNGGTYYRYQYFLFNDLFDAHSSKGSGYINKIIGWQKRLGIKRHIPNQFDRLYGGSQWFSITRDAATYLIEYTRKHPAFYNRLKYTFAPEETYVTTVLMNSRFSSQVINDNCRLILWRHENGNFPANLSEKHFFDISTSTAFFARKMEYPICEKLIQHIDHYLLRDEKVHIAETGYWEHDTLDGHFFDSGLSSALIRLYRLMKIETAIEFGCGPGWYVAALRREGIPIIGYDGNPYVEELSGLLLNNKYPCKTVDLTDDLSSNEPYDLILCLEVGEHIPALHEAQMIRNIVNNAGKYVIISWAVEGQSGEGHINPHSNEYIIQKFSEHGFTEIVPAKNYLREKATLSWLKDTILVFQKVTHE